jgi:hypothetical protein
MNLFPHPLLPGEKGSKKKIFKYRGRVPKAIGIGRG